MSLVCGGRGPCCHIGYAHRHCEHCDVVIPLYHFHYGYSQPYYGSLGVYNGLSNIANQFQQLGGLSGGGATIEVTHEETHDAGQQSSST